MSGILTRARLIGQERLDLEDWLADQNAIRSDSKYFTKSFTSSANHILNGFTVSGLGLKVATVEMTGATLINPENTFDFSWFTAEDGAPDIIVPDAGLQDSAKNFLELRLVEVSGTSVTKAFWDPSANGGQGAEFNQEINTMVELSVEVVASTGGFTGDPDRLPLAIVEVNSSGDIVGITDKRKLFYRLGEPGDPDFEYTWGSQEEPDTQLVLSSVVGIFIAGETLTFSGGATATCTLGGTTSIKASLFNSDSFAEANTLLGGTSGATAVLDTYVHEFSGGDSNISDARENDEALKSQMKAFSGERFWYQAPASSLSGLSKALNSFVVENAIGAQWRWNGTDLSLSQQLRPEISSILARADVAADLDGTTFILQDSAGSVAFWIDIDDSGTSIPAAASTADRAIEITTIATNDDINTVASLLSSAINADSEYTTILDTDTVRVTDVNNGPRTPAADVDTGFTIERVQTGSGNLSPTDADIIAKLRLFGELSDLDLTRQDGSGGSDAITLADGEVMFLKLPVFGASRTYSGEGSGDTNYQVIDIASFVPADDIYWLAYREATSVYVRGTGQLNSGEEIGISDGVTEDTISYIGADSPNDATPNYPSSDIVTQGINLTGAIGELDDQVKSNLDTIATISAQGNQDRTIKLIKGGTFSWNLATTTLTWTADAYIQVPDLLNTANTILAGSSAGMALDNTILYVDINRVAPGGNLSVQTATVGSFTITDNIVIIARRVGTDVIVGSSSFLLKDGEFLEVDGALAEINRQLGQLKITAHESAGNKVRLASGEQALLDGNFIKQELNGLLMDFSGATINFTTGVILEDDDSTPLGADFSPFAIPVGEYFWYGIGIVPAASTATNEQEVQIEVTTATASNASQALAPLATVSGDKKLGTVLIFNNAGTLEVTEINRLGVGAGGGGGGLGGGIDTYYADNFESTAAGDFQKGNGAFLSGGVFVGSLIDFESTNDKNIIRYTQAAGSLGNYIAIPNIEIGEIQQGKDNTLVFYSTYTGDTDDLGIVAHDVTNSQKLNTIINVEATGVGPTKRYEIKFFVPDSSTEVTVGFETLVENIGAVFDFYSVELNTKPFTLVNYTDQNDIIGTFGVKLLNDNGGDTRGMASGGEQMSAYVLENDTIYAAGISTSFRAGQNAGTNFLPQKVVLNRNDHGELLQIATAHASSYVLDSNGHVYSFGENAQGQLGQGDTLDRMVATRIEYFVTNSITISRIITAREDYYINGSVFFITSEGHLYACGEGGQGQLGLGDTSNRNVPERVGTLTDIVEVSVSSTSSAAHVFALTSTGAMYYWGNANDYCLGNGSLTDILVPTLSSLTDVKKVMANSTVNTAVTATRSYSIALKNDGTLWGSGINSQGQMGQGNTTTVQNWIEIPLPGGATSYTDFISMDGTYAFIIMTTNEKKVYGCGYNIYSQIPNGSSSLAINNTVYLLEDSQGIQGNVDDIYAGGSISYSRTMIRCGTNYYVAGYNDKGQFGNGNVVDTSAAGPFQYTYQPMFGFKKDVAIKQIRPVGNSAETGTIVLYEDGTIDYTGDYRGYAGHNDPGNNINQWSFKSVRINEKGLTANQGDGHIVSNGFNKFQYIRYQGHAGFGSTNTVINYFTNLIENSGGELLQVSNNSTDGISFTAIKDCIVNASWSMDGSSSSFIGFSLNSTELTTDILSITDADRLAVSVNVSTASGHISVPVIMKAGDVLRPHSEGTAFDDANRHAISVTAIDTSTTVLQPLTRTVYLSDVKSNGVNGGTFTAGADQTRDLNTLEGDTSFVSILSNQFTVPSGDYNMYFRCPAYKTNAHRAFLYDITNGQEVPGGLGSNSVSQSATNNQTDSIIQVSVSITSSNIYEIRHRCTTTVASIGFGEQGFGASTGRSEIYTSGQIDKVK